MNSTLNYQLPTFTGLMTHSWVPTAYVRDEDETQLDAQVRSGDYFVTLATELDGIARKIDDYIIRGEIEDHVSDLIHLQDSYTITKNNELN